MRRASAVGDRRDRACGKEQDMSVRTLTISVIVIGLCLLVASNAMYFGRTKDKPFKRFWAAPNHLRSRVFSS